MPTSKHALALLALGFCLAPALFADPCGMVPPLYIGPGVAIERTGLQKTYVFYRNGIETFAVRPGFKGKVDDFGMLIPMPTVPEIHKIADDTFAHIAAAIDPPEISVYLYPGRGIWGGPMPSSSARRMEAGSPERQRPPRPPSCRPHAMSQKPNRGRKRNPDRRSRQRDCPPAGLRSPRRLTSRVCNSSKQRTST